MDERLRFIVAVTDGVGMGEACRRFGISRKSGYKWLERYKQLGPGGLEDLSRAPHRRPWALSEDMTDVVLDARIRHPTWGPRKLLAWLAGKHPRQQFPAPSTVGDLLRRRGLVKSRRRRRRIPPHTVARGGRFDAPNETWCADFKGWFRVGDGRRCDPLTVTDGHSRFLLCCKAVDKPTYEHVQTQFERLFWEYGLPSYIRTDNGPPFASTALGGLSRLSVWWLKLGITPDRIEPGKPQQNGRHERMHRTLGAETASPPAASLRAQQARFDRFRDRYNHDRPHEALGNKTPASHYRPAPRQYPSKQPAVQYPSTWQVRSVRSNGEIKWRSTKLFVSETLVGEAVGLEQITDSQWLVRFSTVPLAIIDERSKAPILIPI